MTSTCQVDEALLAQIEALRLDKDSQGNAAIICTSVYNNRSVPPSVLSELTLFHNNCVRRTTAGKIDQDRFLVVQEHQGFVGIEELEEMLPESAPRYVVLSIKVGQPA